MRLWYSSIFTLQTNIADPISKNVPTVFQVSSIRNTPQTLTSSTSSVYLALNFFLFSTGYQARLLAPESKRTVLARSETLTAQKKKKNER